MESDKAGKMEEGSWKFKRGMADWVGGKDTIRGWSWEIVIAKTGVPDQPPVSRCLGPGPRQDIYGSEAPSLDPGIRPHTQS